MNVHEHRSFRRWDREDPPARILLIRFHAFGDVAILLGAAAGIKAAYPTTTIDFLTSEATASLARATTLFDRIVTFPASASRALRIREAIASGLELHRTGYDVVVDMQRNWTSRLVRRITSPAAWGEFDRFSPQLAGMRTLETVHRTGFQQVEFPYVLPIENTLLHEARDLLRSNGWHNDQRIVVLNPAGLWTTRHWPLEHFARLAGLLAGKAPTCIVLLGTDRLSERAGALAGMLRDIPHISLVGKTSPALALSVLQLSSAMVSEDSGLMHMSWISGIPTIGLLGSTNHVWSSPMGPHTAVFHSGDLPCSACMSPECRFGDVHCLTRVTPERVFEVLMTIQGTREGNSGTQNFQGFPTVIRGMAENPLHRTR